METMVWALVPDSSVTDNSGRVQDTMSMRERRDDECVALYRQGDMRAFEELVRRYQDRVYRFVLRMIGSREESLDLAQETLLKAFQGLPRWRPQAQFSTWLFQIARNTAIDALRRRKLVEYVPIGDDVDLPDQGLSPESQLQLVQRCRNLQAALLRLSPEHREVLLLREVEEMAYDEIAETLGLPEGTVKSRLARARLELLAICRHGTY